MDKSHTFARIFKRKQREAFSLPFPPVPIAGRGKKALFACVFLCLCSMLLPFTAFLGAFFPSPLTAYAADVPSHAPLNQAALNKAAINQADPSYATAPQDQRLTLRIGINQLYSSFHGNDQEAGYLTDYMNRLSYYCAMKRNCDIAFEFVTASSDRELEQMLKDGRVDLVEVALHDDSQWSGSYSPEFMAAAKLLSEPLGTNLFSLCTLKKRHDIYYENIPQFEGLRIGALQSMDELHLLQDYASQKGFHYTLRQFSQISDMEDALERGDISAAITDLGSPELCRIIAPLGKVQLTLATSAKKRSSLELVQDLQDLLYTYEPFFNSSLAARYFSERENLFQAFTLEERIYINKNPIIRIALCKNDKPNVYYDEKTRTYKGAYIEILHLMSRHSGIHFQYVPADSWDDCLFLVYEGKADAVLGVYALTTLAEKWNLSFSVPLMSQYIMVLCEQGFTAQEKYIQTVALSSERSEEWIAYIRQFFPSWDERFYTSERQCLDAVSKGLVNFALVDANAFQLDPLYQRYKGANTLSSLSQKVDVAVGTSRNAPAILYRIINKTVRSLSESEIISSQMNSSLEYPFSLEGFFQAYFPYIIPITAGVIMIIAGLFITAEHRKRYADQKTAFFSNMSHEIRTPLNGIIGMTEITRQSVEHPDKVSVCLDKIDYSSKHLLAIVNDILDLSRLEKRKMLISSEPFDLGALLRSMHMVYYYQAKERGIRYNTEISGLTRDQLVGDYTRINQVLMNLLSNALKFTDCGKSFALRVTQLEQRGCNIRLLFEVSDEGSGIPKENLGKIFNAYEQQGAKTTERFGGSGLGLPISKQLVELMGGRLTVKSQVGKGSLFSFTLDFDIQSKYQEPPEPGGLTAGGALVLEEDPNLYQYLCLLLRDQGFPQDRIFGNLDSCKDFLSAASDSCKDFLSAASAASQGQFSQSPQFAKGSPLRDPDAQAYHRQSASPSLVCFLNRNHSSLGPRELRCALGGGGDLKLVLYAPIDQGDSLAGAAGAAGVAGAAGAAGVAGAAEAAGVAGAAEAAGMAGAAGAAGVAGAAEAAGMAGAAGAAGVAGAAEAAGMAGAAGAAFMEIPFFPSDLRRALSLLAQPPRPDPKLASPDAAPGFPDSTVLIVEDNPINLEILYELIRPWGCRIDTAKDGEEALRRFVNAPPFYYDLIFMDIRMPKMDGYASTRAIRSLKRQDARLVPIIAMTANAFPEDMREAERAGMNRHLAKPVNLKELNGTLTEFLSPKAR